MPLLDITDPIFARIPEHFESYWPSSEALLDTKVNEMLGSGLGQAAVLRSAMTTEWNGLRIALRNKAVVIGDMLTKQLVGSTFVNKASGAIQGVFAQVEWGNIDTRGTPDQVFMSLQRVVVPAALAALTQIPLAGQLATAYFNIGLRLAEMFSEQDTLEMPWAEYSDQSDEYLAGTMVLNGYSRTVDQTDLFRPPFSTGQGWSLGTSFKPGTKKTPENLRGYVWAPLEKNGSMPWRKDGIGVMPGSLRMFGQTQVVPFTNQLAPALRRNGRASGSFTPKDWPIQPPPIITNCGDYFPATANTCGSLWSLIGSIGSPDMYKVHVQTLLDEWRTIFETMEQSFIELWNHPNELMKMVGTQTHAQARLTLSCAMQPWVATRIMPGAPWSFGMPWRVPSNWGLVTPAIYSGGKPGDPMGRTPSLWIEEDLAHDLTKDNAGLLLYPGWPYRETAPDEDGVYGQLPKQHPCSKFKACSADLAATLLPEQVVHPASYLTSNGPAPKGYRKMPWPPPEVDAAQYASPYMAIIKPALERLKAQQIACLKRTVVCAYVRPVDLNSSQPAYGAFRDETLRQLCLDVREALLKHPLRFAVNLADAEAIDPQFAKRLKESGVTGSIQDFSKSMGLALLPDAPAPPKNEPPLGGVPFERRGRRPRRRGRQDATGSGLWLFGGALAIGALTVMALGGKRSR